MLPQTPQFETLVRRSLSQPFARLPSQFPKLRLHDPNVQVPVAHDALAFAKAQAAPQAPQFESVLSAVSQPFAASPSQSAKFPTQEFTRHAPASHRASPFATEHTRPHAPQCVRSVAVSTQALPHRCSLAPQPLAQAPARASHTGVAPEHAVPHAPQFIALLSAVSQPFAAFASQSPNPAAQAPTPHAPATHAGVAFAAAHAVPHAPQFARSVRVFASQPFAATRSQSAKPGAHTIAHVPPSHTLVAFAPDAQRVPHAPQCAVSTAALTHWAPQASSPSGQPPSDTRTSVAPAASNKGPAPASSAAPASPALTRSARDASRRTVSSSLGPHAPSPADASASASPTSIVPLRREVRSRMGPSVPRVTADHRAAAITSR
jgi:hypothetical protein